MKTTDNHPSFQSTFHSTLLSTFHPGEQAIQERLGVKEKMDQLGTRVIRDHMPDQHRELFQKLPMLVIGAVDPKGHPWATLLTGRPGFIHSPDNKTLEVNATIIEDDPLAESLTAQRDIGLLGIEFETRRRNRVNAVIESTRGEKLRFKVKQSFGNCPRYIQRRRHYWTDSPAKVTESRDFEHLDTGAIETINSADSFFIASLFMDGNNNSNRGADVSHRGGLPGFVAIDDNHTLTFPDYSGNHFFNTLGNLQLDSRAGLLFVDYRSNTLLYLTGHAEIIWDDARMSEFPGAERLVRFTLARGRVVTNALPIRWEFQDYSPILNKRKS